MSNLFNGQKLLSRRGFLKILGSSLASVSMAVDGLVTGASSAGRPGSTSLRGPHTPADPSPTATVSPPSVPVSAPPRSDILKVVSARGAQAVNGGPLTDSERAALYEASLALIARLPAEALAAANRIGVQHPSNMCGPLAAYLLNTVQIIGPMEPKRFWLLNTRDAYTNQMLRTIFPPERFFRGAFRTPTNLFDFNRFPLYAGDFLVLYAGSLGSFNHVLTVTRVDDSGRAFALTNLNIGPGPNGRDQFIVDEVMLYDPAQPGMGQFYEWTNRSKNFRLGLTGGGGFDLWRRWNAGPDLSMSPGKLQLMLDAILTQGGLWSAKIKRLDGDVVFDKNSTTATHPASIIKIAVGMLLLAMVEARGADVATALQQAYVGKRSYADLLRAMITNSEEPATVRLVNLLLTQLGIRSITSLLARWGAPHTLLVPRRSAADDVVNLLEALYQGRALSPASTQILLGHLAEVTVGDKGRLWALKSAAPDRVEIYNKRASLTNPLVVGDAGILKFTGDDGSQETYVVCLLGYADGSVTYEKLEMLIGDCVLAWYRAKMWMNGYRLDYVQDV